jgi:AhpD family alkylhydroperoxidase
MLTADWVRCLYRAAWVKFKVLAAATKVRRLSGERCRWLSIKVAYGYYQIDLFFKWITMLHIWPKFKKKEANMLENQMELQAQIHGQWERYKALMPHIAEAYADLPNQAYGEGVVSSKMKRLMAMTAATIHGCRACILYQADEALKLGASKEEFLECIGVAVSLGGTMAEGQATRLIGFLEEREIL